MLRIIRLANQNYVETVQPVAIEHPINTAATNDYYRMYDQHLIEMLSRKVLMENVTWQSTSQRVYEFLTQTNFDTILNDQTFQQTRLFDLDFPKAILDQSTFLTEKFANIAYFRADVRVNIKAQANQFQQGVLWIWQEPQPSDSFNVIESLREHRRSITSYPGVMLNLQSENREVEIVIPYTNENQAIKPTSGEEMASLVGSVLCQLEGPTASEKVPLLITANFENIELYGLVPKSTNLKYVTQAGEDESATKTGIISDVCNKVADVADTISGIPSMASIAKPIAWASRLGAGVASYFGYSRPRDLSKNDIYSNIPARGFTHLTGIDTSISLSAMPDNAIDSSKANFSKQDEMAISYLASRPYVHQIYKWSTSNVAGSKIGSFEYAPVSLTDMGATLKYTNSYGTFIHGAPISYVASLFKFFRGNLVMNLSFSKSMIHQGRLLVQYAPYGLSAQADFETVHNEIIDLNTTGPEGVEVRFPMVLNNRWAAVPESEESASEAGSILFTVLNPLVVNANVSSNVHMVVQVHWEDLEFAGLNRTISVPSTGDNPVPPVFPKPPVESDSATPIAVGSFTHIHTYDDVIGALVRQAYTDIGFTTNNETTVATHRRTPLKLRLTTVDKSEDFLITLIYQYDVVKACQHDIILPTKPFSAALFFEEHFELGNTITNVSYHPLMDTPPLVDISFAGQSYGDEQDLVRSILFYTRDALHAGNPITSYFTTLPDMGEGWLIQLVEDKGLNVIKKHTMFAHYIVHNKVGMDYWIEDFAVVKNNCVMKVWPYSRPFKFKPNSITYKTQSGDESSNLTTIGESVISLRAISRRYTFRKYGQIVSPKPSEQYSSLYDILSYLYIFYHGSVNIKYVIDRPDSNLIAVSSMGEDNTKTHGSFSFSPLHIQDVSLNPIIEVSLPYYSKTTNVRNTESSRWVPNISLNYLNSDKEVQSYTMIAAGDDHTFTYLVGAPIFMMGSVADLTPNPK